MIYSIAFFLVGPLAIMIEAIGDNRPYVAPDIISLSFDPLMYMYVAVPLFTGMFSF